MALEHRENLRQGHGAHLHPAQGELFAGNPPGEVVHQFFFAQGKAFDDARFLALEGLAFENLRDAPTQEVYARLNFLLEGIRQAARKGQQPGPVRVLEIIDVAAVRRGLILRVQVLDHPHDHAAAARSRKTADKQVVAGGGQLDSHPQRAQGALLPHVAPGGLDLCRGFERNVSGIAMPPEFFRGQGRVLGTGIFGHSAFHQLF